MMFTLSFLLSLTLAVDAMAMKSMDTAESIKTTESIETMESSASKKIICDYQMYGVAFSRVELGFLESGQAEEFVTVSVQGKSHRESFQLVEALPGESLHGWISKESSENSIEMIIYEEKQSAGDSKLINHHVPFGKEIWGNCTTTSSEAF